MDGSGATAFEDLTQALIATATAATQTVQAASKKDLARLIPRPGVSTQSTENRRSSSGATGFGASNNIFGSGG